MTPKYNPKSKLIARSIEIKIMQRHPSLGSQPGRRHLLHAGYETKTLSCFNLCLVHF